jgi:hypothetical protein
MYAAALNCTEPAGGRHKAAKPHRPFPILKERTNLSGNLRVERQLAVLPTCKPLGGANPKAPIAGGEQASDRSAREMLTCGRPPRDRSNTVEVEQAGFRAEPEISVGRLSNGGDGTFEKAVADRPCVVRVLIDVDRRV